MMGFDHFSDAFDSFNEMWSHIDQPVNYPTEIEGKKFFDSVRVFKGDLDFTNQKLSQSIECIAIAGRIYYETEKAYLLSDFNGKFWIPKSFVYGFDKDNSVVFVRESFNKKYIPQGVNNESV